MSGEIYDLNAPIVPVVTPEEETKTEQVESEPTETQPEPSEVSEDELLAADEDTEIAESEPVKEDHRDRAAEKRIAKLVKEREQLKGQLALYQQSQSTQSNADEVVEVVDYSLPDPANYPDGVNDIDYRLDVREAQREAAKKDLAFKDQIKSAYTKYPDLHGFIEADQSKTNATMVQLIKESPVAVDLFYHLMANPEVSNKIASMSPALSAREIGKIEAQLEARVKATPPVAGKKATPPPAPINPVKSAKTVATTLKQVKYTEY